MVHHDDNSGHASAPEGVSGERRQPPLTGLRAEPHQIVFPAPTQRSVRGVLVRDKHIWLLSTAHCTRAPRHSQSEVAPIADSSTANLQRIRIPVTPSWTLPLREQPRSAGDEGKKEDLKRCVACRYRWPVFGTGQDASLM